VFYFLNLKTNRITENINEEISFFLCKNVLPSALREICVGIYVSFLNFVVNGNDSLSSITNHIQDRLNKINNLGVYLTDYLQ